MCGIVGRVSSDTPIDQACFARMVDSLVARGPDGRGAEFFHDGKVALGHRRLAIVDLTPAGAQPMSTADRALWLSCNGELYNHAALRRELEARGHQYRSRSDSETILHAYAEWGDACVQRFRGIFAFAIWDERRQRLFVARDQLGVKPLYYRHEARTIAFASQPRALLHLPDYEPRFDAAAYVDSLAYGIVPDERCAFAGMCKLPPGHTLIWEAGALRVQRYWQLAHAVQIVNADEACARIESALHEAVELQLMSDVPVATLLSGGVDSSLLTALAAQWGAAPVNTFTVGFDEVRSDERRFADQVVRRYSTCHHESVLRRESAFDLIDRVVEIYDEPFGMGAALPMIFIAEQVHRAGFKVVLAGDGADELFAGYTHYDALAARYRRRGRRRMDDIGNWPLHLLTRAVLGRFDPLEHYRPHEAMIGPALRRRLLGSNAPPFEDWRRQRYFPPDQPPVRAGQILDLHTYLPDEILVKLDRASMAFGVEARVPFLDHKLVELAFSIEPALHYQAGRRKSLLKRVAAPHLPSALLDNRKKGFSVPLDLWLTDGEFTRRCRDELTDGWLVGAGLLDAQALTRALSADAIGFTLQLYLLERWARRWIG